MIRTIVVSSTYAMAEQMGSLIGHRVVGPNGGGCVGPEGKQRAGTRGGAPGQP